MSLKKNIKQKLFNSPQGIVFFYKLRILREKWAKATLSDYAYIKKEYKKRFGREINLKNPKTLSEKLQWLKLFYRNDQMPVCSDKYDLRLFLKKYGYEHLLNEVLAVYENNEQIEKMDIESLPQSFVVKATHGSGWNLIVKDKNNIDWKIWKKIFKQWLKLDLSVFGREWNYREIKPRILIEKFIDQNPMIDYKVTCINGIPQYILVLFNENNQRFMDIYDLDWNKISDISSAFRPSSYKHKKPDKLEEILEIATNLSKEFPYVRVDFYYYKQTIILSELTFFSTSGFLSLNNEAALYYGNKLTLPKPNYNLDLYRNLQAK